jgi:hypothetical protein
LLVKTIFLFVRFVVLADDDVGQVSRRMTELKVASASLARAFLASETRKAREAVCLVLGVGEGLLFAAAAVQFGVFARRQKKNARSDGSFLCCTYTTYD